MTYHDAAYLSMTFIQAHLYDIDVMKYPDSLLSLDPCAADLVFAYDSGMYLSALSVFAYVTDNDTLTTQYVLFNVLPSHF